MRGAKVVQMWQWQDDEAVLFQFPASRNGSHDGHCVTRGIRSSMASWHAGNWQLGGMMRHVAERD